jgi:Domain of unknown function (DUF4202)
VSRVLAAIDAANSADPTLVQAEGRLVPAELLYGERMSAALAEFMPDASEALTIAARGQHIERWTSAQGRNGFGIAAARWLASPGGTPKNGILGQITMIRVCSELWEKSQSGAPEPSMPLSSWTPKGQA